MLYFLVYNDNTHTNYLNKLLDTVKLYGKQFEIVIFNKTDIDSEFVINNSAILNCNRGGGYWLWKPYIINKMLSKVNENDIIFYIDSKYYFLEEFAHLYINYIKNNDLLVWKNKPNENLWYMKNWCKMDVILKYNMYNEVFIDNLKICWAGGLIIKKTKNTVKCIQEWLDMCCVYEDITDSESVIENSNLFREHRHDQSLLSIVLYKNNIETYFFEKKYVQNVRDPFISTNNI